MRKKRIANEWAYLASLVQQNPMLLRVTGWRQEPAGEYFDLILDGTPAYVGSPSGIQIRSSHIVAIRFPEFYPAVPCEAFLKETVFHPNVHPANGFVCLWDRFSPGDSVIEAVQQMQRVVSWTLYNPSPEHVMQPEALARASEIRPLKYERITAPLDLARERTFRRFSEGRVKRARLSEYF